jgi:hypothetical protein
MLYVDQLFATQKSAQWPFEEACHLTADSPEELDAFAVRLGLKERWHQHEGRASYHYDLTRGMRWKAIGMGAVEVTSKEFAAHLWRKVEERKKGAGDSTLGSLATFGYSQKDVNVEHELRCALIANKKAVIIDTRLHPVCSWSSFWTRESLARAWNRDGRKGYVWLGNWLGNINHNKEGAPIRLVDERRGIAWCIKTLSKGYTIILLCVCSNYDTCHRNYIYRKVQEALGNRLPEYVLGQRVLTPCGPGHIDSSIPLDVHRARNRYAVVLDVPCQDRYFFPAELQPEERVQPDGTD